VEQVKSERGRKKSAGGIPWLGKWGEGKMCLFWQLKICRKKTEGGRVIYFNVWRVRYPSFLSTIFGMEGGVTLQEEKSLEFMPFPPKQSGSKSGR